MSVFILLYYLFIYVLVVLSLPLQGVLAIILVCLSGMPVVYRQKRTGKDGRPFVLYKFRTMQVGAEQKRDTYRILNPASGPVFKIHNDPRFTRIGKFLSHTGLDELPQLFNVARGDMALFGPRPLPVAEAAKLSAWQKKRHAIRPGIISPWVLEGYHRTSFDNWMKSDIRYVSQKSLALDMRLFCISMVYMTRLLAREVRSIVLLS
jgi:lipopolysaccharide/colanic/teichoic acid biosynthesis glycosyltransferase